MNKNEKFEKLLSDWKAAISKFEASIIEQRTTFCSIKKLSNVAMQMNEEPCDYNHKVLKAYGDKFCKECGVAIYD